MLIQGGSVDTASVLRQSGDSAPPDSHFTVALLRARRWWVNGAKSYFVASVTAKGGCDWGVTGIRCRKQVATRGG
ncbi:hypothetical protein LRC537489_20260 [Mycobacterium riyadhense]